MRSAPPRVEDLVGRARAVIPGGVNSGNRVLPWPFAIVEARGAYLTDADGRSYLDYHAAFGPIVLGHADPIINDAVRDALGRVDLIGAGVTDLEVTLAEALVDLVPSAERVLLTNSGSEATYAALRLSRAATKRQHVVKFQGAYHGWHDAVAMNVMTPRERLGQTDRLSGGMVDAVVDQTLVLPFNDIERLTATFREHGGEIAAVIIEIIQHNVGCMIPSTAFLQAARRLTEEHGAVLIFDEVITGFRHSLGGYQEIVGVTPDLTTLGKAMANGYPIAALVGRASLMDRFGPEGDVFFAGTFNGHAVGTSASLATIDRLRDGEVHRHTARLAEVAADGLAGIAAEFGIPMTVGRFGSVFTPYFYDGPVSTYVDLLANDTALDVWFRRSMCEAGVFMIPTAMKRNHVSAAHTDQDIARTLESARDVLRSAPPKGA